MSTRKERAGSFFIRSSDLSLLSSSMLSDSMLMCFSMSFSTEVDSASSMRFGLSRRAAMVS
ncbi:MAG: hypothetical protein OSP8Acid_06680 [uncultured Acidilobus sp. OSP8]|jgi:hypothetical protein|nr:MAG: hypothetical protein OSP8Acid_06680 [uncultured Acidilobus sp. OSP8]